jgi:UDP-N-acetylmuramoylalanine--D-glutamate ligase
LKIGPHEFAGRRVTVMGLGLHGGGLASALFLARHGARVTVTDHRQDPAAFQAFLPELAAHGVRTVLGRHEPSDFTQTDLVVKNPAVPLSSPFLALARERDIPVETDLSIFLGLCPGPVLAVTGSKGKSTSATALARCLQTRHAGCRLGGNVTVSPLGFLEDLAPEDPVVLELSSWQLSDLRDRGLLAPRVSLVTCILPDHQDKYPDLESYVADKRVLFASQKPGQFAVFNADDPWQRDFPQGTAAEVHWFSRAPLGPDRPGAYLQNGAGLRREAGRTVTLLPPRLAVPGEHNRLNLLAAGLGARLFGLEPEPIAAALGSFAGIEHRLELVAEREGVRIYNDSAATIPEATAAALESLPAPVFLIAGGTDKNLEFRPLAGAAGRAAGIYLLAGSATRKIEALFRAEGIAFEGPFPGLAPAFQRAWEASRLRAARAGAAGGASLLFSPGCASFELFLNEFDRGRRFKELVAALP